MSRKRSFPGSIFVRKGTTKLYIRYKTKQIATNLTDTTENRKIAAKILENLFLVDKGYVDVPAVKREITFEDVWSVYFNEKLFGLSKKTQRSYLLSYQRIVTDSKATFSELSIKRFLNEFRSQPRKHAGNGYVTKPTTNISATTHNIYLRSFLVFISWAVKQKYIDTDVRLFEDFKRRDGSHKVVKTIQDKDLQKLLEYWMNKDKEFYLLLYFLSLTGARITETLRLRWIDITDKRIYFPNKVKRYETNMFPVTEKVQETLDELRMMNPDKVFSWSESSDSRLRKRLLDSFQELNIPQGKGDGFHLFRKTFSTMLFVNKLPLSDIKELMRHSSIQTTLEHYKEVRSSELGASLNTIQTKQDNS